MAKKALAQRANWQTESGKKGARAEWDLQSAFKAYFKDTDFDIVPKPKDFAHIYENFKLPPEIYNRIFHPKTTDKTGKTVDVKYTHGFKPDYAIRNNKTGKTLYVEVKRQDGWIENKKPSAGRGNAHERSCKYFTPGLLSITKEKSKITQKSALPFWVVFVGDITRDPKRVREIHFWYKGFEQHFFFWDDQTDTTRLFQHFEQKLKKFLL